MTTSHQSTVESHHSTVELGGVVLTLRDGLISSLRQLVGRSVYVIEDEINSKFYRIGIPEYTFISLLDGYTTVGEAMGKSADVLGDQALAEHEVGALCKWLIDSQLAVTDESRSAGRLLESESKQKAQQLATRFNPVTPKFPLCNPDQLLGLLHRWCGWLFSLPAFVIWGATVATGVYCATASWGRLTSASSQVITSDNWIWLLMTWLLLKVVHETSHGLACKRFGGTVREMGLLFILLVPLPYIDVTSTWRFASKWQRIFTSAAGMYAELFIAALAAILWSRSDSAVVAQQAMNVMFSASVVTLLFNANPLMRFDGYYILTDLLDVPNLASHASQFMRQLGRKYVLGLPARFQRWPDGKAWLIAAYGPLALGWRVLICIGIFLAAESLFYGAGLVVGLFAVLVWVVIPIVRLLRFVSFGNEIETPNRRRFVTVTATVFAGLAVTLVFVPWYGTVTAPAIVDYHPMEEVRTAVPGFIREVEVQDGDLVSEGDTLVVLENHEIEMQTRSLRAEIKQATVRARAYRTAKEIPAFQVEMKNLAALETRLEEKQRESSLLVVRARETGLVIGDDLESLVGSFAPTGYHLLSIGPNGNKRIHALVSQANFDNFVERTEDDVKVHIWGAGSMSGILERVSPRASANLIHPAFSTVAGGPVPVRMVAGHDEQANGNGNSQSHFEATEPYFMASVRLHEDASATLLSGRLGRVSFQANRGAIGEVLWQSLSRWISRGRPSG